MASFSSDRHFCIYADVSGTPDGTLSGEVWLDQDPTYGEYDPFSEFSLRGSVVETLSWRITHVFPYSESGIARSKYRRRIRIADRYTMSRATMQALQSKFNSHGTKYRFYDGENIFRVWFPLDPPGFKFRRAEVPWREGRMLANPPDTSFIFYDYEIVLDVLQVVSSTEGMA